MAASGHGRWPSTPRWHPVPFGPIAGKRSPRRPAGRRRLRRPPDL